MSREKEKCVREFVERNVSVSDVNNENAVTIKWKRVQDVDVFLVPLNYTTPFCENCYRIMNDTEYAKKIRRSQQTVSYNHKKILSKMKMLMKFLTSF